MATVQFGNTAADMRLVNDGYGIPALQTFDAYIENFVAVRQEALVSTNTQLVVSVYNFASEFVRISATGNVPTSQFTTLSVEALGTREVIAGSFFIDLAGFISGTATEVSAIQVADSVLLARVAGVSIPVAVDLGFPTDAALLSGNDSITSGNGDDYLLAYEGDDSVEGGPGNDTIDGGPGNDALNGGTGDDIYIVGDAGDVISEVSGSDTVQSYIPWLLADGLENLTLLGTATQGTGNAVGNTMLGNASANALTGLGGADLIQGLGGDDWIEGESGNDPLPMGQVAGADNLSGGDGNDTILAGGGDDLVHGDAGDDTIVGEAGFDVIYGGDGQDALDGRAGGDVIHGDVGVDVIFGDADSDTLYGGDQNDVMMGERGVYSTVGALDVLYGEAGNDLLDGGAGGDWIFGGEGNDVIDGDEGSDYVIGGAGIEYMLGSDASLYGPETTGQDLFVYLSMLDAGDEIWGFDTRVGTHDGVDLRPLFDGLGYAGTNPRAEGWMTVTTGAVPTDSVVWIDSNGGGNSFTPLFTLHEVAPATLTDSLFLFQ